MSAFSGAFSYLQKIGKCMMLPVSVLPVAGILLGVGSANFPWLPPIVSQIMAQSGGAIFSNLPLLFAIGVAIGAIDLSRSHGYCQDCEQPQLPADRLLGIDGWLTCRARRRGSAASSCRACAPWPGASTPSRGSSETRAW